MNEREIDQILKQAAAAPPAVDPALLVRITGSLGSTLAPVRPLPAAWKLIVLLLLIWAAVAAGAATILGTFGIAHLSALESGTIFPLLTALAFLSASLCVAQIIPGCRQVVSPRVFVIAACASLCVLFPLLFQDYAMTRYLQAGTKCLTAGIAVAFPAGVLSWVVLRRGYSVDPVSAGLAAGSLAGLCGITMLELHCPNQELFHILLWHIAVVPLSAVACAAIAAAWPPLDTEQPGANGPVQ